MRGFFHGLGSVLNAFAYGRYGNDSLNNALMLCGLLLILLSAIPYCDFLFVAAAILWFIALFRTYSRNIIKRRQELLKYQSILAKIKKRRADSKTHRYFKCKTCKTVLRVPKGKGKIKISCPKCRAEIIRKT